MNEPRKKKKKKEKKTNPQLSVFFPPPKYNPPSDAVIYITSPPHNKRYLRCSRMQLTVPCDSPKTLWRLPRAFTGANQCLPGRWQTRPAPSRYSVGMRGSMDIHDYGHAWHAYMNTSPLRRFWGVMLVPTHALPINQTSWGIWSLHYSIGENNLIIVQEKNSLMIVQVKITWL